MRYGAIASRRGTRREIGGMSAAGDQGEARKAWQEVEKRDKTVVATRGANRGARRGRERDFHNITPPITATAQSIQRVSNDALGLTLEVCGTYSVPRVSELTVFCVPVHTARGRARASCLRALCPSACYLP